MSIQKTLLKFHLPLGLAFGLLIGYLFPSPGIAYSKIIPTNNWIKTSNLNVIIIFFLSGLKLQTKQVLQALSAWKAVLFGCFLILIVTPIVSFLLVNIPFETPQLSYGLAIFFLGPTTITSGVILTGIAKGNIALGLMLTVITNLLAILTMPLTLPLVFSTVEGLKVEINAGQLLAKLLLYILLPLLMGKCINYLFNSKVTIITKHFKIRLKLLSSFLLILIPWMSVSNSADKFETLSGLEILAVFGIGIFLHFVFLIITYTTSLKCFNFSLANRKAVVILGSQKTLPVALSVISFLPLALGSHGIISLPCIIAHFCQIVMDGVVAAKWAEYVDEDTNERGSEMIEEGLVDEEKTNGVLSETVLLDEK